MARRRKNPSFKDMLQGTLHGTIVAPLVTKAKDHVVNYYSKKGKRRRNPEVLLPTDLDETLLAANDVAELLGGEFIPLKGMIIGENEVQLITEPGVRLANGTKTRLRNKLSKRVSNPKKSRYSYTILDNLTNTKVNDAFSLASAKSKAIDNYKETGRSTLVKVHDGFNTPIFIVNKWSPRGKKLIG